MKEVYHESKDPEDGFLYIIYCDYDPFGTIIWNKINNLTEIYVLLKLVKFIHFNI